MVLKSLLVVLENGQKISQHVNQVSFSFFILYLLGLILMSKIILCQEVRELYSFHVHIYIFCVFVSSE